MVKSIKIRTIFDASDSETPGTGLDCREVNPKTGEYEFRTRTVQSERENCDINHIMARYEKTGMLPDLIKADPRYGDFTEVPDFLEAQQVVAHALTQFQALDARVRDRFDNDPARMLEFCADPKNADEMVTLGLAVRRSPQPATPIPPGAPVGNSGAGPSGAGSASTPVGGSGA